MSDVLSKAATASEIARAVTSGKAKASAVVDAALKRIEAAEPTVNAFTDIVADRARKRAARDRRRPASRARWRACRSRSRTCSTSQGLPTRAGSKINVDGPNARRDGALVRKLEAAGAILVGGLNMGEYAYDFTGENAHYGPSRNPHDPTRMTGGSSGGSGAAVAAGEVPLALGSDTNGSIRVPASLCGLFGLKPTYGRLSRAGSFPFVDAFDHLGPLARSAEDLALSFDAMQGWDPDDPVCTDRDAEPTVPTLRRGHRRPAHRHRRRLFRQGRRARSASRPWRPWPRRWARPKTVVLPERGRGARGGLCHHRHGGRAAAPAAAARRGRRISIPTRASASWRARCCRAPGT